MNPAVLLIKHSFKVSAEIPDSLPGELKHIVPCKRLPELLVRIIFHNLFENIQQRIIAALLGQTLSDIIRPFQHKVLVLVQINHVKRIIGIPQHPYNIIVKSGFFIRPVFQQKERNEKNDKKHHYKKKHSPGFLQRLQELIKGDGNDGIPAIVQLKIVNSPLLSIHPFNRRIIGGMLAGLDIMEKSKISILNFFLRKIFSRYMPVQQCSFPV